MILSSASAALSPPNDELLSAVFEVGQGPVAPALPNFINNPVVFPNGNKSSEASPQRNGAASLSTTLPPPMVSEDSFRRTFQSLKRKHSITSGAFEMFVDNGDKELDSWLHAPCHTASATKAPYCPPTQSEALISICAALDVFSDEEGNEEMPNGTTQLAKDARTRKIVGQSVRQVAHRMLDSDHLFDDVTSSFFLLKVAEEKAVDPLQLQQGGNPHNGKRNSSSSSSVQVRTSVTLSLRDEVHSARNSLTHENGPRSPSTSPSNQSRRVEPPHRSSIPRSPREAPFEVSTMRNTAALSPVSPGSHRHSLPRSPQILSKGVCEGLRRVAKANSSPSCPSRPVSGAVRAPANPSSPPRPRQSPQESFVRRNYVFPAKQPDSQTPSARHSKRR